MPEDYAKKNDLNVLDKRLTKEIIAIREKLAEHGQRIAELNVKYDNLADLPQTINSLNTTLTIVSERMESMNINMNAIRNSVEEQRQIVQNLRDENQHQNEIIDEIDNKSKIDWAKAVSNNFWKIILVIAAIYLMIKDYL